MRSAGAAHRHVSHLYGVYPSEQINVRDTPGIDSGSESNAQCARRQIDRLGDRLAAGAVDAHGRGRARLRNPARVAGAGADLSEYVRRHPPFQIDGNFRRRGGDPGNAGAVLGRRDPHPRGLAQGVAGRFAARRARPRRRRTRPGLGRWPDEAPALARQARRQDTKPRWERRKDARPQELLAAAIDLFVERGYAATRLEDVARRAGVSKGTLYLYYENKEELFKAVVRSSIVPVIGEAEDPPVAEFDGHSAELLRHLIHSWWQRLGATKAVRHHQAGHGRSRQLPRTGPVLPGRRSSTAAPRP
jgi:hypothetical protein